MASFFLYCLVYCLVYCLGLLALGTVVFAIRAILRLDDLPHDNCE